ncbi:MAG TPA: hypothetical protein VIN08_25470 [Ohtaekwangia sp.]|uniref:hypothetical protein n=1 Tax=Ohtaekwangia sp. TaxID=2066019 RepID=UPI002F95D037
MSTTNEQSKANEQGKSNELSKAASTKEQEVTTALTEVIGHLVVGVVGYIFGKGTAESAQQKEIENLRAKLNEQKMQNRRLQNALSGISHEQPDDLQRKPNAYFTNPSTGKPLHTIWLD